MVSQSGNVEMVNMSDPAAEATPTSKSKAQLQIESAVSLGKSYLMDFSKKYLDNGDAAAGGAGAAGSAGAKGGNSLVPALAHFGVKRLVLRSWAGEFAFVQKPQKVDMSKALRNFHYFKCNYACVLGAVLCMGLLLNPSSLFVLILISGGWAGLLVSVWT